MRVKALTILLGLLVGVAVAQNAPPTDEPHMGQMQRPGVGGEITAIDGSMLTLQTFRGETAKVKLTADTRIRKQGADAKASDLKVGDHVMIAGDQGKDGVWTAQAVRSGRGGMGAGGPRAASAFKPEDNGKTFIFGEVTKIEGTRLTVRKPDGSEQVIEVDDDTSFQSEHAQSITLQDVKIGQMVRGQGELKAGVFVPKQLHAAARRPWQASPERPQAGVGAQSPAAPESNQQSDQQK